MPQILLSNDAAPNISLLSDHHPELTKSAAILASFIEIVSLAFRGIEAESYLNTHYCHV